MVVEHYTAIATILCAQVRVLVIPVSRTTSNSDYEDYSPARPSLSTLLTLLTSMLGG